MFIRIPEQRADRPGTVAVWLLVSLLVILGIVAIGMDGGRMMEERRQVQATVDAAALAAAEELYNATLPSSSGRSWRSRRRSKTRKTATQAALDVAKANGFNNDGKTSIVKVNIPPKSGEFAGRNDHAEVIITSNLSGTFSGIFKKNTLPVKARAVAVGRTLPVGAVLLKQNGANAFLNDSVAFTLVNSRMYVNSTNSHAFKQKKAGLVVGDFNIAGGADTGGAIIVGSMNTGTRQVGDPLRDLPVPDTTSMTIRSNSQLVPGVLPVILQPGVYRGGIKIEKLAKVTMLPGTYVMEGGGLEVTDTGLLTALEVFVYNTSGSKTPAGSISVDKLGTVVWTAPTSGNYQGISIFQDRAVNKNINLTGNVATSISGTIYAPAADVKLTSAVAVGLTFGGAYICNTLEVGGFGAINIDLGNNRPPIPEVALVE